jgi:NAD(P)-dependent dehydrogenase (short-subunit alcohol dehydrogenase family)
LQPTLNPGDAWIQRLDVTDTKEIQEVVSRSEERFGSLDVLVNNAGFGFRAAVEEADAKDFVKPWGTRF